jgi:histidine kinase
MKLPSIMVGRDKDLEAVKIQFDSLLEGRRALTVVAGDTGIGKTTLVKKALVDLAQANGTCIYGKFEQYNGDQPYLAIIQILEQITGHMLTLPEEKLHRLRKELINKLGRDRALITWMVPQTRGILGQLRSIKINDYQRLQIKLEKSLQALIAVAAGGIVSPGYCCG